ncbi:trans-sialidase-like protein [Trypanosoma cruzi]|uniref:Trans-sialidase, putative n=1 Tax=Trypanosoma cruzi (strain CL Brener) TaxID=353153 RepID=Q4D2I1_TRYCC|nr:trans-sialidase, putative [Trypanosoma cruzi]EAN86731.1 trans-sialidase, putative [Trypanosoma cruzi]RNC34257.1 trans-sialidase-like protein [Trypanosoma cruzi]|eukprot:XP_808582.1 trans-sialidase [Trypanosoma cruzi strain CL Brener]
MLSRFAVVMLLNKHNRRRVTGSSGRRRERPNMSRHLFNSAMLLLLVVMMCCGSGGASNAVESKSGDGQKLQWVDLFFPNQTLVVAKGGTSQETKRDAFASPSLVSAGGVIAAFAEGLMYAEYVVEGGKIIEPISSDIVAEYIDSSWDRSTLVGKVKEDTWKAHTVLGTTDGTDNRVDVFYRPTTTTKGNKVFLLAGSLSGLKESNRSRKWDNLGLKLVVGDVTNPTSSELTERIEWDQISSLLNESIIAAHEGNLKEFFAAGGSGVLMENGTLVFPLMAKSGNSDIYSMIIYSKDDGSTWALSEGMSPAKCLNPRITEWEGSLLMIVDCEDEQKVYESRDMGRSWTEAIGTLSGVWVKSRSFFWYLSLHVEAFITATIEGRKVMLYTQRGYASGEKRATALYVWVTDNNRSFHFGPVGMDNAALREELASSLLYSGGNLHLLQRRDSGEGSFMSLSRLTDELSTIKSVLSTWSQKDIFFSSFSIPTAGLVAVLSDEASDGRWNDEYLCLNATVTNATKVKEGMQLTESNSGVLWPVNTRDDNLRHVFLSHDFTVVATVTIKNAPSADAPLLGAMWGDTNSSYTMGILYTADNKWETIFNGTKTTRSSTWESGKEYQVALMLQGNKSSMYVDGQSLGEKETLLTGEKPLELVHFCFGACGIKNFPVTVKNVFLYNRPLNPTEMTAIKDRKPVPKRAPEPQVGGVPQTIAPAGPAVPGPREVPAAPGRTTVGRTANTQHAPAGSLTSAGNEGTARETGDGGANGNAGSAYGRVLPLLLLLGLWGFAAA